MSIRLLLLPSSDFVYDDFVNEYYAYSRQTAKNGARYIGAGLFRVNIFAARSHSYK